MAVGLQLAGNNDFVRVQEDINDNLIKLDEAIDFNLLATLGIEYGGILNNTNAKVAGKAYYDTTGKKLYKCIVNTSINYADAGYFEALSNNDLLGKLNNLLTGINVVASAGDSVMTVVKNGRVDEYLTIARPDINTSRIIIEVKKSGIYDLCFTGASSGPSVDLEVSRGLFTTDIVTVNKLSFNNEIIDFVKTVSGGDDIGTYSVTGYVALGTYYFERFEGSGSTSKNGSLCFSAYLRG